LVGDAGYFKDPITAHGITDALRDAELLARAIITAARGEADEAVALAAYQATRDRLSERLFATTDAIASFSWDLDHIPRLLRQLSEAMSDEVTWLNELEPIGADAQTFGTSCGFRGVFNSAQRTSSAERDTLGKTWPYTSAVIEIPSGR
jgi:2-polyprenyl-6-methoxyphenol hydroxylase-like FAD-dependent oxidoreductase